MCRSQPLRRRRRRKRATSFTEGRLKRQKCLQLLQSKDYLDSVVRAMPTKAKGSAAQSQALLGEIAGAGKAPQRVAGNGGGISAVAMLGPGVAGVTVAPASQTVAGNAAQDQATLRREKNSAARKLKRAEAGTLAKEARGAKVRWYVKEKHLSAVQAEAKVQELEVAAAAAVAAKQSSKKKRKRTCKQQQKKKKRTKKRKR